uniref:Uncharacterized protein n=1 Tax=Timema cristinae TaxID=61476 RepID=A0A7R9H587_TIMCR|nr:unnamed protein product [Timema cristinae]
MHFRDQLSISTYENFSEQAKGTNTFAGKGDDNEHEKPAKKKKIRVFKKEGEEGTTRAANVEELQEKVNALKTLKGWYLIVDFGL